VPEEPREPREPRDLSVSPMAESRSLSLLGAMGYFSQLLQLLLTPLSTPWPLLLLLPLPLPLPLPLLPPLGLLPFQALARGARPCRKQRASFQRETSAAMEPLACEEGRWPLFERLKLTHFPAPSLEPFRTRAAASACEVAWEDWSVALSWETLGALDSPQLGHPALTEPRSGSPVAALFGTLQTLAFPGHNRRLLLAASRRQLLKGTFFKCYSARGGQMRDAQPLSSTPGC